MLGKGGAGKLIALIGSVPVPLGSLKKIPSTDTDEGSCRSDPTSGTDSEAATDSLDAP